MPTTRTQSRLSRGRLIVRVLRDPRCETDKSSVSKGKNNSGDKSVKNKKTISVQRKNVKKPVKTTVKNVESVAKESPVKLRARRNVQYVESSLDESTRKEEANTKKVPIYKQHINEKKTRKRKDDYEFDSDDENKKKPKRGNENVSDLNDTSLENFLNKAIKRKKHKTGDEENLPNKAIMRKKHKARDKENFPVEATMKKHTTRDKENFPIKAIMRKQHKTRDEQYISSPLKNVPPDAELYISSPFKNVPPNSELYISSPLKSVPPDAELYISSPFKSVPPNANSTMINNKVLTPWRFNDINIKRNPHFISYKQSSLPHINQEMVLDHTIVDKLNETSKTINPCHSTPQNNTTSKPLKQATLNDYYESNKENQASVSLFDIDQFSPVKTKNRIENVTGNVRRKILGEKNENVNSQVSISIPSLVSLKSKSPVKDKENGVDNNFGFDSDDDDGNNGSPRNKCNKPFRVSMNLNDKKYQCKKKVCFKKAASVAESLADSDEESNVNDLDDLENENGQYKLFEDFDSTQHHEVKRKRKFGGDHRDLQKLKKRKDMRTKEEEEEAEKWAAAFNSMCEEVEQFPLEIE